MAWFLVTHWDNFTFTFLIFHTFHLIPYNSVVKCWVRVLAGAGNF